MTAPGKRIDGEPSDEAEHFIQCAKCNDWIDMRDLGQVFDHEENPCNRKVTQ